jgi:hypothetical protein
VTRAVYIWKCSDCAARLRVLAEIVDVGTSDPSTIKCPVCLSEKTIEGRPVRIFMDSEDNRPLDVLDFQGDDN